MTHMEWIWIIVMTVLVWVVLTWANSTTTNKGRFI